MFPDSHKTKTQLINQWLADIHGFSVETGYNSGMFVEKSAIPGFEILRRVGEGGMGDVF